MNQVLKNFEKIVEFTLGWEAGKTKDGKLRPDGGLNDDDGSPTKWGIRQKAHPNVDVPNLTLEGAKQIYYDNYWLPLQCDQYSVHDAAAIFDTGVNLGVHRTKGIVTRATRYGTKELGKTVISMREVHYYNLESYDPKKWKRFMKGWLARTNDLKKFCDILKQETT